MKLPKFSKLKPQLPHVLVGVLVLAVLFEAFVLYKAFYAGVDAPDHGGQALDQRPQAVIFDIEQYEAVIQWIEDNRNYELPSYSLTNSGTASSTPSVGRENPFAN